MLSMAIKRNTKLGLKTYTKQKSKNNQPEYELQKSVVDYIRLKYPHVFFNGSAGGIWTSFSQGRKMKATGYQSGFPDLFIYEARKGYHGLAIELKVKGNYASPKQKRVLAILNEKGYRAEVCTDFDQVSQILSEYLES